MMDKNIALTKTYDLMVWLFPQIGKFPREYRFILGDRIEITIRNLRKRFLYGAVFFVEASNRG